AESVGGVSGERFNKPARRSGDGVRIERTERGRARQPACGCAGSGRETRPIQSARQRRWELTTNAAREVGGRALRSRIARASRGNSANPAPLQTWANAD